MSVVGSTPRQPTPWWSASKHSEDLGPLNTCAGFIAALLIVPGLFAGGGGLTGLVLGALSIVPSIVVAVAAWRRHGPRSARIAFIAAGVLVLMIALQLRA